MSVDQRLGNYACSQMQPASSLVNKMLLKHCHTHSFQSEIFEIKITEVLQVILKWSLVHD